MVKSSVVFMFLFVTGLFFLPVLATANPATIRVRILKDLEEFPHILHGQVKQVSESMWQVQGTHLIWQNKKLPAQNLIVKKENNKYDIISVLDFNFYLAGVVTGEMPLHWPIEALKAQAVVARSFALARMKERRNRVFHLDSNQLDQVFVMPGSNRAVRAVVETENTILKDQSGKILKAFYHSDCGGQTIPASQVWENAIDTGTAKDPWCAKRKLNRWNFEISKIEFYDKLNQDLMDPTTALRYFRSRIQSIQLGMNEFSVQKLRETFGFSLIKNSPEKLEFTDDSVLISGRGFGHGAGLCQRGSQAQAERGASYMQILEHYYPKALVSKNEIHLTQILALDFVSR